MQALKLNSVVSRISFAGVAMTSFEVIELAIEDLFAPVSTVSAFTEEIRESIEQSGLMNPIIVVRLPREDAVRHFKKSSGEARNAAPLPTGFPEAPVINMIWGGSNRVAAAKLLGYTHVDCVIIPDFYVAGAAQNQQRAAYKLVRDTEEVTDGFAGKAV